MNLYKLHTKPEQLYGYKNRLAHPTIAWDAFEQDRIDGVVDTRKYLPGILKGARESYNFAEEIMKGPFKEGESIIATDPQYAHNYAAYILYDRFPEGEPAIMKDPHYAAWYASDILKQRWPNAEKYIMKDPRSAVRYANDMFKGAWPEAEPYIKQDAQQSYQYARNMSIYTPQRVRFREGEPAIMKDPNTAYDYAYVILNRRWPEAEPYIKQDVTAWAAYKNAFDMK